jgi:hypothetical protein
VRRNVVVGVFIGYAVHLGWIEMQSQIDQFTDAIRHSSLVFGYLYNAAITKGLGICRPEPENARNTFDVGVVARVTLHSLNVKIEVY